MADDEGGQQTLPGTTTDDGAADKLARAEERARKAEARAKDIERKQKERDDNEAKAKRDAELKSADDAKRALADAEAREKKANERLATFEKREAERIDTLVKQLPESERERVLRYRDRLGDEFGAFVQDELKRSAPGGGGDDDLGGVPTEETINPPPPANPGEVKRRSMGKGRTIEPWAAARLEEMGVDTTAARNSLIVERDGKSAKFIFPPAKMRNLIRERAQQPAMLNQEQYERLHKGK